MVPQFRPPIPGARTSRPDLAGVLRGERRRVAELRDELTDAHTAPARRTELREALLAELGRHFAMEARLLHPVIRQVLPDGDELAGHAAVAHDHVARSMLRLARTDVDSPAFVPMVRRLVDAACRHLAEEEAEVVPGLRRSLPPAALTALAGGIGGTGRGAREVAGGRRDNNGAASWLTERLRRANRLRELTAGRASYPPVRRHTTRRG